ncbi:putative quinol monooxygenase [Kitasatospora sp. NPDC098652]|uniref:putative quinol monooxygenase n=1 Tax=Kitasatospora sp. NPDC098652 TaxID=3364095 RepID=UPI0037F6F433
MATLKVVAEFLRVKELCYSQFFTESCKTQPTRKGRTMGFGLVVRFVAHDATAAQAFDALAEEALNGIRAEEPGTLVYVNHAVANDPRVRVFYELYTDREAFEEHERQPHVRRFLAERGQYLESFEVTFLDEVSGKGGSATQTVR